jgi:competence protein ComEC
VQREAGAKEFASGVEALRALRRRGRVLAAGDTLCRGNGYRVRVLWPPAGETGLAGNARSVVLAVEVGTGPQRLLLTGDADSTIEASWLGAAGGRANCLKLGHHGSRSSSGVAALAALAPEVAVVSCGRRNRFGHPHAETLSRLAASGARVRRTDREGTIRLDFGSAPAAPPNTPLPRLGV